jgi:cytochrome P450
MTLYPDVQARAQAEIDAVTDGSSRPPTLADRAALPYVCALVKEVLRCAVVAPQGGMRQLGVDDVYDGYLLPRGAIVLANVWFVSILHILSSDGDHFSYRYILHDPRTYPDPHTFRPERFLGTKPEPDPRWAFGFGRRVCPGRQLADASVFLTIACTLATLRISKAVDKGGAEINPAVDWAGMLVT